MKMTPLVRYKNVSFDNFKKFLSIYPYTIDKEQTWNEAFKDFDYNPINNNLEGYKKTAYQFACQTGIENRGNDNFEVNDYLFILSDENLKLYLNYWMLTYYAPNPYVKSQDDPKILWIDICEKIIANANLEIDYYEYFHDNINENINVNDPNNTGNPDTLLNALLEHGVFLKLRESRILYIEKEDIEKCVEIIDSIKNNFPIPENYKDKNIFFKRYSFENFNKAQFTNITVNMNVSLCINKLHFENKETIERQITKALKNGKHIILTGPPGTGKSKLAKEICNTFDVNYKMTTAIADWSTYETIGGYKLNKEGNLYFNPGIFLSCFKDNLLNAKNDWLIIDEMNRADIDKAFGVFFSALTGDDIALSFKNEDNKEIEIINEENFYDLNNLQNNQYVIPKDWRLIGTINTFDKTSLFEMSYAFMRRFAFIPIPIPKKIDNALIESYLNLWNINNITLENTLLSEALVNIWNTINTYRSIGPAIIKDIATYIEKEDDFADAIVLYVLPQFEGLDEIDIKKFINEIFSLGIKGVNNNNSLFNTFLEDFFGISLQK